MAAPSHSTPTWKSAGPPPSPPGQDITPKIIGNNSSRLQVDGDLTIAGSPTYTGLADGSTIAVAGNVIATNPGFGGTGTILLNGGGTQTITGNTAGATAYGLPGVAIAKPSGVVDLVGNISIAGSWDNSADRGTVDAGSSTVAFVGGNPKQVVVDATGMSFHNVTVARTSTALSRRAGRTRRFRLRAT